MLASGNNQGSQHPEYIPEDKQHKLITIDTVDKVMKAFELPVNDDHGHSVVDQILPPSSSKSSRRKLFTILFLASELAHIFSFIKKGIWDDHLPLQRNTRSKIWECHGDTESDTKLKVACSNENLLSSKSNSTKFEHYQWFLLAPVFNLRSPQVIHYPLYRLTRVPFNECTPGDQSQKEGGFGEVWRVKIHPAHHNWEFSDPSFAVKRLKSGNKDDFNREIEVLRRFRDDHNPHLVKLLATYHFNNSYHLIFPWANGDLREYWRRNPEPKKSYQTARWIAEQSFGIAEALRKVHDDDFRGTSDDRACSPKMKGRHGDIKPENILLFPPSAGNTETFQNDQGVLALSDFGLARFHRSVSMNRKYNHNLSVSYTYRAPEYDLDHEVSTSWDIWALGCVYLEFIIWYLQGWGALEEFSTKRRAHKTAINDREDAYFYRGRRAKFGARRKAEVDKRIQELRVHKNCTGFIRDFLSLIDKDMICIRSEDRMDCAVIATRMQDMSEKCGRCEAYLAESGRKWTTSMSDKKQM
ncbi:kinase-like domain-containing protein [Nemania diffusa]|nr:kinase-like domain-containing protein [Nemania diffusa]